MSTIFTFFARLAQNSGYLAHVDKLELADLPHDLIAATSSRDFPDLVLKTAQRDEQTVGGEFVELKDAKSMSITSFNSAIPAGGKSIDTLSAKIRGEVQAADGSSKGHDMRDVYYLIRGRNLKATPSPLTKVCLVSGYFFETTPVENLISDAFQQVANEATGEETEFPSGMFERQELFSKVRHVNKASVKIRFRIMTEAEASTNILNSEHYPEIEYDTLSMLIHLDADAAQLPAATRRVYPWRDAAIHFGNLPAYRELDAAFAATEPRLATVAAAFILDHPLNGPFFVVRIPLNW